MTHSPSGTTTPATLLPFEYGSSQIRAIADEQGNP